MTRTQPWGKRVLCLVLCVISLICVSSPAVALTAQETAQPQWNELYTAKIRNSPSFSATVIGTMAEDTCVAVLDRQEQFYKIDCHGMTGYIAAAQVELRQDGAYYVNCDPDSDETGLLDCLTKEETEQFRQAIVTLAQYQLGDPYVYGGSSPGGFDCSGLTSYLYMCMGRGIHRTATGQLQDGLIVAREDLQAGDLVFFRTPYEYYPVSHVGIYVGDGRIIHAGSKGIVYADLDGAWFRDYYLCSRRVVCPVMTGIDCQIIANAVTAADYCRETSALRTAN